LADQIMMAQSRLLGTFVAACIAISATGASPVDAGDEKEGLASKGNLRVGVYPAARLDRP